MWQIDISYLAKTKKKILPVALFLFKFVLLPFRVIPYKFHPEISAPALPLPPGNASPHSLYKRIGKIKFKRSYLRKELLGRSVQGEV